MDIHPAYKNRLAQFQSHIAHEAALVAVDGLVLVSTSGDGLTLQALVRPANHHVTRAGFGGAASPVQRGLLEALCSTIEGRPIQEAAEHAVIAVERALRDPAIPVAVRGLVMPENADPAFVWIQRLVRALRDEYARLAGFNQTVNFYDRPAHPSWRKLDGAGRLQRLNGVVAQLGLAGQLHVQEVEDVKRVIIAFDAELSSLGQQEIVVRLENAFRETVEPTLYVLLQAKSDKNVVRMPSIRKTS